MRRVTRAGAVLLVLLSVVVGAAVGAPPARPAATTTTAHGLGSARDLVVDPSTGRVYVAGGDGVAVFAADGSLLTTVSGIAGAGPMVLTGTSLWVIATTTPALARIDLTTSTLAEVVPVTGPVSDSIAAAGNGIFFVRPGLDSYEIVRLDVVSHAIASSPSLAGVRVATIPGATDRLVAYNRLTPGIVAIVGATAPFATITSVSSGANANEVEVGPDGDTFWTVSAGGGLVERRVSTGALTDAVYPTDAHSRHVAYGAARGGMLASWSDSSDKLFVSIRGTTTGLSVLGTSALVAGVGVSTDGAAAYYVDQTSLVRIGLESSIASVTPTSYVAGVPATIVAKGVGLGGSASATVGGVPATITAVAPAQVSVAFPTVLGPGTHDLALTGPLGTATRSITVVANTGATLTGIVRVGGTATAGVAVRVSGGALVTPVDVATTAAGRYTVPGLPLGSGYRLEVTQPAGATSGHVVDGLTLVPNQVTTIDVDLRSPGASSSFVTPTTLPGQGGLNNLDVEATTGRVFVSRDSDLLVMGRDGAFVGRLIGIGPVRRVTSGNGVTYVTSATAEGIRVRRLDPATLRVTGSWLLDAPSNGEITLVGSRLFVLAGTAPSYESGTYDLRTFDPATGATAVVPAPRKYAGLQAVQRDTARLIGLNLAGTSILDVSGPTAIATGQVFFSTFPTFVVADGPTNRMWTSTGAELDLSTLEPTGRTFAASGVPRVAAGAGVVLFGSTVFRLDDPAQATHVLTPGQFWLLAPTGDRAYGTIVGTNQFAVAADLTPHLTEPVAEPVGTGGATLSLTGYSLLPTSAVAIDGVGVPFTVPSHDRVEVTTGPLAPGTHQVTVTTPWGTTAPLPFTAQAPGSISGVVRSTARPLAGMVVLISPAAAPSIRTSAVTGPDGSFTVPSLPAGSYKVFTMDGAALFGAPPAYVGEWYQGSGPGTAAFGSATAVTVGAGATSTLSPIVLHAVSPGSIAGVVTDGTAPLANAAILVSPVSAPSVSAYAVTAADGSFSVGGLAPGAYKVMTLDAAVLLGRPARYVAEYYADVADSPTAFAASTTVVVTAGAATTLGPIALARV